MKQNYQMELDKIIQTNQEKGIVPSLLLHSCCAPCSSYCLEYLTQFFHITIFYYNPNISPAGEYDKRVEEQKRLIEVLNTKAVHKICFVKGEYRPEEFYAMAKGMEDLPEGGERCFRCYELRLRKAAILAKEEGFDYFTTTLSISPHKNAQKLNEIGERLGIEYGVSHLPSDFKKRNGYKRSVELSKEYDLYRQDYCGCVFSKKEYMEREKNNL